jgi:S1-C subfamily serine protease
VREKGIEMKKIVLLILLSTSVASAHFESDTAPYSTTHKDMDGMRILKELPKELGIAKLGVQKGDIILDVDGRPIDSRASGFEAYRAKNPKSATIWRNNKQMILGSNK